MKRISLLVLISTVMLFSCKKEEKEQQPATQQPLSAFSNMKKFPEKIISIDLKDKMPQSPLDMDKAGPILDQHKLSGPFPGGNEVAYVNPIKEWINWETGAYAWTFEANEHAVYSDYEDQIYPGAIIKGNSVESFDFNPVIGYHPLPITVSVSLPAPVGQVAATIPQPALTATTQMVNNVLLNTQFAQGGFSKYNLNIKEFTYYDELKEFFASSKNTNAIFFNTSSSTSGNIHTVSKNTGLMAKFIQKNFTVDMDIPKAGQLIDLNVDNTILGNYSPLYVSSVTYGCLGIITVESDYQFDELKSAFQKAFGILGVVNGSNTLNQYDIDIINSADIKVYLVGGQGAQAVQTINGYQNFLQYLGGGQTFSAQAPGVPITFSMRYLSDHKAYKAQFMINYGKIEKVYARIEHLNKQRHETRNGQSLLITETADIFIAFYQDKNCTMPAKASNVIQFNHNMQHSTEIKRPDEISNYNVKDYLEKSRNVNKGSRLLLHENYTVYSYDAYLGAEEDYTEQSFYYTLKPGNGYTVLTGIY